MGRKRVKFNLQTASCGPCLRKAETNIKAATAFCKTCGDFLCNECIKPHRRLVAVEKHQVIDRDHVIKDSSYHDSSAQTWDEILEKHNEKMAEEIAKLDPHVLKKYEVFRQQTLDCMKQVEEVDDEEDSFDEEIEVLPVYKFTEPCPEHQEEVIKYFCHNHEQLCCEVCKIVHHRHCSTKVTFIPDELVESDGQYKVDPFRKIGEQVEDLKEFDKNLQNDLRELKRSKDAFLYDLQVKKREILNWLNLMEVRAIRRVDIVFDKCKRDIDVKRKKSKETRDEIRAESYFLKEIVANDTFDDIYKFIKSKSAEKVTNACQKKRGHRKFTTTRFSMRPNPDFEKMKADIDHLYEIKFKTKGEDKYSVRLKDDKFVPNVTGCTFLKNGNIVIADCNNSKIKQFSPSFKQLSHLCMSGGVFDICDISSNAVVVSSPNVSNINIVEFQTGNVEIAKTIDTGPGKCFGITHHEGMFAVNIEMDNSYYVRVVDLEGQVLFNTETAPSNYLIFRMSEPKDTRENNDINIVTLASFAEGRNEDIEYYVDEMTDPTSSLSLTQYNYLKHLHTKGVALDSHNNVVVCCPDVDHIYTISTSGEEAELMLAESDGLCRPQSLAYNSDKTTLLVTSENSDFVQLFKFDHQQQRID